MMVVLMTKSVTHLLKGGGNMKRIAKKMSAVMLAFIVTLTFMPAMQGNYVEAASKKPATVTGAKAVRKANSIYFSWKKAKRATKYQVYLKKNKGKWKKKVTTKAKKVRIANLKWNTKYYIKVRAVNGKKAGKFSGTWYGKIGKKVTLQTLAKNGSVKKAFTDVEKQYTTDDFSTKLTVSGNTLGYTMKLKYSLSASDKAKFRKELAKQFKTASMKKEMKADIKKMEYDTGLSGIKIKLNIKAKDGTSLFTYKYS